MLKKNVAKGKVAVLYEFGANTYAARCGANPVGFKKPAAVFAGHLPKNAGHT
jgi:hypothetical protein